MKKFSVQFLASALLLGCCLLFSADSVAQTKGTSIQTSKPGGGISTVTKSFEFTQGGLTILPTGSDVNYTVYEKASLTSNWVKTQTGSVLLKDGKEVDICKTSAAQVKVEISLRCDFCADVQYKESCQ